MDLSHLIPNNNQFFTGGLFLGIMGGAAALIRAPLMSLWSRLINMCFVGVEILNSDALYDDLQSWLGEIPSASRFRQLSAYVNGTYRNSNGMSSLQIPPDKDKRKRNIKFSASPGTHFVVFEQTFIWVTRLRLETADTQSTTYKELLHLRIFCLSPAKAKRIVEEAAYLGRAYWANKVSFYTINTYGNWDIVARQDPRPLESVILQDGHLEYLLSDCNEFRNSKEWYCNMGIPYRRGYLLFGAPGNGKTSSIIAVAGYHGCDIYPVQISNPMLSDSTLLSLMSLIPTNAVVLLEDVDSVFNNSDANVHTNTMPNMPGLVKMGVTLSGLLNAIDGACSSEGRILFMTTNHRDKLNPALIRPGRIDVQIEFKNAVPEQAGRMLKKFFPEATETQMETFGSRVEGGDVSMAQLQQHFMTHRESLASALSEPFIIYKEESDADGPGLPIRSPAAGSGNPWTAPCGGGSGEWQDESPYVQVRSTISNGHGT